MAASDYYLCDICEEKTFYDANVNYDSWGNGLQLNPKTGHAWPDGDIGNMAVICKDCSKTHEIIIQIRKKSGE